MKKILRKGFGGFVGALLLAAELAVLADWITAALGITLPLLPWLTGAGVVFLLLALLPVRRHRLPDLAQSLLVLFLVTLLGSQGLLFYLRRTGGYAELDRGKAALSGGKLVLVTVPEPGEETILAGGVIEEYLRYGSEVQLLYTGDASADAARAAALSYGIPAENASVRGDRTAAEALRGILQALQPEVILAAAPETGVEVPDLAALLSALREELPEYRPLVLQGFLHALGTEAPADFYDSPNLLSTREPAVSVKGFAWDKRIRLPVAAGTLSRALPDKGPCFAWLTKESAEKIVNGDRVFRQLGSAAAENEPAFLKLQNEQGDFIYDYYIDPMGKETFTLYTSGAADQACWVSVEGERCSAKLGQGRTVNVTCPKGRQCIVTVTSDDGKYWDTVLISNPGRFSRETGQALEQGCRQFWEEILPASNSGRLAARLWTWLRPMLPAKG